MMNSRLTSSSRGVNLTTKGFMLVSFERGDMRAAAVTGPPLPERAPGEDSRESLSSLGPRFTKQFLVEAREGASPTPPILPNSFIGDLQSSSWKCWSQQIELRTSGFYARRELFLYNQGSWNSNWIWYVWKIKMLFSIQCEN